MAKADEPAFPDPHYEGSTVTGLTKREYFAAMAMQGILANGSRKDIDLIAQYSVVLADTILKELE